MTPVQIAAKYHASRWRADVGRLPLSHQQQFVRLVEQHGEERVRDAITTVAHRGFRRSADRWRLFLAYFGESP